MMGEGSVTVKEMPESMTRHAAAEFQAKLRSCLDRNRPWLVFDFSRVRQIDSAGIELLLFCMEEVVKRNGDLKLAAVPPAAAVILEITRVDRFFECFATVADAVESFHRFPATAFPDSSGDSPVLTEPGSA